MVDFKPQPSVSGRGLNVSHFTWTVLSNIHKPLLFAFGDYILGTLCMQIAIEGCCHGDLDKIYSTLQHLESKQRIKVDLLICCGDFQVRFGSFPALSIPVTWEISVVTEHAKCAGCAKSGRSRVSGLPAKVQRAQKFLQVLHWRTRSAYTDPFQ